MKRFVAAALLCVLGSSAPSRVSAHDDIVTFGEVTVEPGRIVCEATMDLRDVLKLDGRDPALVSTLSESGFEPSVRRILTNAGKAMILRDAQGERPLTLEGHALLRATSDGSAGEPAKTPEPFDRLRLRWIWTGSLGERAELRSVLFEELGFGHRNLVVLKQGDQSSEWLLMPRQMLPLDVPAGAGEDGRESGGPVPAAGIAPVEGAAAPFRRISLLLFLAALGLVPGETRDGPARARRLASFLLLLVLGGTAAGLGMNGRLRPPDRFVDTTVFLTAGYAALENFWIADGRGRWILALLFAPVHGLAFGNLLTWTTTSGLVYSPWFSSGRLAASPLFFAAAAAVTAIAAGLSLTLGPRVPRRWSRTLSGLILAASIVGLAGRLFAQGGLNGWR